MAEPISLSSLAGVDLKAASRPPRKWRKWLEVLVPVALLALAVGLRVPSIDRPFARNPKGIGSYYGTLARNFLRQDLLATKFAPMQSVGVSGVDPQVFYLNHPPLHPWLMALGYVAFDVGEWQTRLVPAIFTVATAMLIYVLIRRRATMRAAVLATVFFLCMPLALIFGGQPEVIACQLLFFVLLSVAMYQRFHANPTSATLAGVCLAFAGAAATDWPAFLLLPVVCLHYVFTMSWRRWGWIILLGLFGVAAFAGIYAYLSWAAGDWHLIYQQALRRSSQKLSDTGAAVPFLDWAQTWFIGVGQRLLSMLTPIVPLIAAGWLVMTFLRIGRSTNAEMVARILMAWAALHVAVGRQGVLIHDWWWWPVALAVSIAAALFIDEAVQTLTGGGRLRAVLNTVALVGIVAFAGWYGRMAGDPWPEGPGYPYSLKQLGSAISAAAGPNQAVIVVDGNDGASKDDPSWWFYGDRPLKMRVWWIGQFQEAMATRHTDLPFGYKQPWTPRPAGLVFPTHWMARPGAERWAVPFYKYLEERYPAKEMEHFALFDLTKRKDGSPAD